MKKFKIYFSSFFFQMMLLFVALFVFRFLLFVDRAPIGIEECHTGAVARELIANGLQFPVEQYSPEYYENSLILGSFLTVIPAKIFGIVPFSLEIIPFLFAFGCLALGCALLRRSGHGNMIWLFSLFYLFAAEPFFYAMHDSVGNHIIGLFFCMLILFYFYRFIADGKIVHFYAFMFFAGLGFSIHFASALYTVVCVIAYFVIRKWRRDDNGAAVSPDEMQLFHGLACVVTGLVPFYYFVVRTKSMNILYMFTIVSSRNAAKGSLAESAGDFWGAAISSISRVGYLSYPVILLFIASAAYMVLAGKREMKREQFSLLLLLCLLIPVSACAVFVFSGGGKNNTYFPYMIQPMYILAAMIISVFISKAARRGRAAEVAVYALAALVFLGPQIALKQKKNFSLYHSYNELFGDKETAYCYWRFGRAFANFTERESGEKKHLAGVKKKCDRFSELAQRNECLWGGMCGFKNISPQIAEGLNPDEASLAARGSGFWKLSAEQCYSDVTHKPLVDECVLGFIERYTLSNFQVKKSEKEPGEKLAINIPCLPREPQFSGLTQIIRNSVRKGTIESEAEKCGLQIERKDAVDVDINKVCAAVIGYCGAAESRADACGKLSYSTALKIECENVYKHVAEAMREGHLPESGQPAMAQ